MKDTDMQKNVSEKAKDLEALLNYELWNDYIYIGMCIEF